jgi:hypothetical protein
LLFENDKGSIGVAISNAISAVPTEIFILWNEVFVHPFTLEVWSHVPATQSFRILFKNGLSSPDSQQCVFNCLAAKVNNDRSLSFDVSSAFTKVSKMTMKKLLAKSKVILKKDVIFAPVMLLSLNQETI